jgi:ABC-type Fe3+ transport system substrate-binding protein
MDEWRHDGKAAQLRKEGFPVMAADISDLPQSLSAGYGMMAMFNRAPHPNAAKVFVNWLASKEGMESYSRAQGGQHVNLMSAFSHKRTLGLFPGSKKWPARRLAKFNRESR